jgi:parallel beta-helix repeat protein
VKVNNKIILQKRKKRKIISSLFFLISILSFSFLIHTQAIKAAGNTYYVDKDNIGGICNNSNPGTISSPVCTVAQAITMASVGDTIYLRTGTYPLIDINKSGSSGNILTITNYGSEVVTVQAGATTADSIRLNNVTYVRIKGLKVTGTNGSYNAGIHVYRGGNNFIENNTVYNNICSNCQGIFVDSSLNNLVSGNTTYNNYESGIVVSAGSAVSNGNTITSNTSYNNTLGGGNSDGIKLQDINTYNNTISYNNVYSNGDDGIDTWTSHNNTLIGNVVHDQTGPGDGNGFKLGGGTTTSGQNILKFNIAYNNSHNGFDVNGGGGNTYYHNIAYGNGHYGFEDGYRNVSCTIGTCPSQFIGNIGMNNTTGNLSAYIYTTVSHNNIWHDQATGNPKVRYNYVTYNSLSTFYTASGNTLDNPSNGTLSSKSSNPLFVNAPGGNFNLSLSSPAIDASDPANPASVSVVGSYADIGAFEYSAPANYLNNVSANLDVVNQSDSSSLESGGTGSSSSTTNTRILKSTGSLVIADIVTDLSVSRDWSTISADVDLANKVSYIHNLTSITGNAATYSLYVPKAVSDSAVIICPGVSSLAAVVAGCTSQQTLTTSSGNVSVVNIGGQIYWKIDNMSGTGGISSATAVGTGLTLTPNSWNGTSTQTICMTYVTQNGEFVNGETIEFIFNPTFANAPTNQTPTADTDADNNSIVDGSFTTITSSKATYTFTGSTTQATTSGINLCLNLNPVVPQASYSISVTDSGGTYGVALLHVAENNNIFITAEVSPTLSFNIRTLDDSADTNTCDLGFVQTTTLPNTNDTDNGAGECGYGLAVGTNSANGFSVTMQSDGPLNNALNSVTNSTEDQTIVAGVESYGLINISAATTGKNPGTGLFDQSINLNGNFIDSNEFTPVPLSTTQIYSYSANIQYIAGGSNADLTKIMHGLTVGTATQSGNYNQLITYQVTVNF